MWLRLRWGPRIQKIYSRFFVFVKDIFAFVQKYLHKRHLTICFTVYKKFLTVFACQFLGVIVKRGCFLIKTLILRLFHISLKKSSFDMVIWPFYPWIISLSSSIIFFDGPLLLNPIFFPNLIFLKSILTTNIHWFTIIKL